MVKHNTPPLITDASYKGLGAVCEQQGHLVICIARKLAKAEQGYSHTLLESLAVFRAVKRLHKYLFNIDLTICTDHKALEFVYYPEKFLSKKSSAKAQRLNVALGAQRYTIEHLSAKHIQEADFMSIYSHVTQLETCC